MTEQLAALDRQLKAEGDLANFKIATLASLLGNSPQALAVAVWNPAKQEGVLTVEKLPALAEDKDYQLWLVDPQYAIPVDGGVFRVDPSTGVAHVTFKANKPIHSVAKFAVSLERKGGVPKAEGPMVLLSQ
jgi:anti-sigma-K factor RskA